MKKKIKIILLFMNFMMHKTKRFWVISKMKVLKALVISNNFKGNFKDESPKGPDGVDPRIFGGNCGSPTGP